MDPVEREKQANLAYQLLARTDLLISSLFTGMEESMFDLIIKDGCIIDGSGAPAYRGDLGINGGVIECVEVLAGAEAREILDACGLAVTPGFIDTHVHSDLILLSDPLLAPALLQGVTTEILGQDGLSYAPRSPRTSSIFISAILRV